MRTALAWAVHLFTASGVVMGLFALEATFAGHYRAAFLWMIAATVVDGMDGWLARMARVREFAAATDGARLDDLVDYVTYVFVPAVLMWHAGLWPVAIAPVVAAAILLASVFGFSRTDAKTPDYFFTGFPSYWNIVALYLFVLGLPPAWNAAIVLALAALVFVPIGYVYPSRTPTLRAFTVGLCIAWGAVLCLVAWRLPQTSAGWTLASLLFPLYYVVLSLLLHARRGAAASP